MRYEVKNYNDLADGDLFYVGEDLMFLVSYVIALNMKYMERNVLQYWKKKRKEYDLVYSERYVIVEIPDSELEAR